MASLGGSATEPSDTDTAAATDNAPIHVRGWYVTTCTTATVYWTSTASTITFGGGARLKDFSPEVDAKARDLLLSVLSPKQRAQLKRTGRFFYVRGGKTRRLYRVERGFAGKIMGIGRGRKAVAELCLVTDNPYEQSVPLDDLLAARKLMIESAEDEFLKIANFHWGREAWAA